MQADSFQWHGSEKAFRTEHAGKASLRGERCVCACERVCVSVDVCACVGPCACVCVCVCVHLCSGMCWACACAFVHSEFCDPR